ncbi:MAG: acylneuraminate cytidylyltransferase family protein [Lachnospiraceae bacterium]|jgi:CMP-N,N'-diacetyllegionaminic acid synthase|nr:acylneuraminate cytidylyltransferase family protein [Lachnospiraceae bacterium]
MNILFTICGRAGSKGFKNKNLKEMNGVPLVFYTLAAIRGYVDWHPENVVSVAVNTDSEPLMELIKGQKCLQICFIERKEELAGDVVPKVEVIQDTYKQLAFKNFDIVIDLDITSPYRRVIDIENIIVEYSKRQYDIVFSVVQARRSPYFNMVEKKDDGFFRKICQSSSTARQQAPQSFELNASIYAYNPYFLNGMTNRTILDYQCGISIMPDFLVLDIDSEEDFEMMQYLHSFYCKKDTGLNEVFVLAKKMI